MDSKVSTPNASGDGAADLPTDEIVAQPFVQRRTSPSVWGPGIIVVKCKKFRSQEDDSLVTIVIKRSNAGSGEASIANVVAKAWEMFELNKPFMSGTSAWDSTLRPPNRIEDVRLRGRVIRNERPVSSWAYIDPEVWDELPLNMEFYLDGAETQLAEFA